MRRSTRDALTSEQLVKLYLKRIEAYDKQGPKINAVLHLNAEALETARALDKERREKGPRSPLHGIPVIVKDVFDTADMPTTGGYLPLKGVKPTQDCDHRQATARGGRHHPRQGQPERLVCAARHRRSSTLGGSTLNPFALDRIPGWSSAGTGAGLAAHFAHRRPRQRNRLLDSHADERQQPLRPVHHLWSHQPRRSDVELHHRRARRADGAQRLRSRGDARRRRRLRLARICGPPTASAKCR